MEAAAALEARSEFAGSGTPAGATTPNADVDAQDGLFDQVVEDTDLEAALEERERKRVVKADATAAYKEVHESAKGKIDALDIEAGSVVRCGRFRIKVSETPSRSVSFETSASKRTTISLLD
jgi:hypothetical protein